jgi:DNA-binding IscR family transcriptional regulator
MRFSQQAQYAICGMFDLAYNGEALPVQVRVIGDRQRIPARYLEQIFQRLRKAELVRGKITLRHIVEAVEGPLAEGLAAGPPPRDRRPAHRPNFLWSELCGRIEAALGDVSLAEVCRRAAGEAVRRVGAEERARA